MKNNIKSIFMVILMFSFSFVLIACGSVKSIPEKDNIVEKLAKEFTFDNNFGNKLYRELEKDPENIELVAIYNYYYAYKSRDNYYNELSIPAIDYSKNFMKYISPEYSGAMAEEIVPFGISLFGSKEIWNKGFIEKLEHLSRVDELQRREIKNWINSRYDYYDQKEGHYCGDKYSKIIFREAATKYQLNVEEIDNIWAGLPL